MLPKGLRAAFKSVCVRRGDTMSDVLAALMKLYVKNPKIVQVKKLAWKYAYTGALVSDEPHPGWFGKDNPGGRGEYTPERAEKSVKTRRERYGDGKVPT